MSHLPRNQRAMVEIDAAAIRHNLGQVRKYAPHAAVMAVVKANAYGHGMEEVVSILDGKLEAIESYAVSSLEDVKRLRECGIKREITTFSGQFDADDIGMIDAGVMPALFDFTQLDALRNYRPQAPLKVWLKVDTGMGRLGFLEDQVSTVLTELRNNPAVSSVALMTHLANADDPENNANQEQYDLTRKLLKNNAFDAVSILNSGGICGSQFASPSPIPHLVRPGLMLYGASPLVGRSAEQLGLVPAMRFSARLISVRKMPAGSKIGYGGTEILKKDSTVGVVGCGYGDGYPRHAKNGTPVYIKGKRCPLLGRVSMDMISVDLSGVDSQVGDRAVLWGAENPIEKVAISAETIPYTLMCGLSERVQRLVING